MSEVSQNPQEYQENPSLWVSLAAQIAKNNESPPLELVEALKISEHPVIKDPYAAQPYLWELFGVPHRDKGLRWLDSHGLLAEILPAWGGNAVRRSLRLNATENVHLEKWREGLDDGVFRLVCDIHDVVIDGRLNRWAWTAVATLLAGGDTENAIQWMKFIRRDLYKVGATEAEIIWVERVLTSFNRGLMFIRGDAKESAMTPAVAVACLSTLHALKEGLTETDFKAAAERINVALADQVNPLDNDDVEK